VVNNGKDRCIVFVCTGNTCRSPMAEAIAADLLSRRARQAAARVLSAGITASNGQPRAREADEALRRIGVRPVGGAARALTREMIAEADAIFAMTSRHRAAIISIDPSASGKVKLLDPDGHDIIDPIGSSVDVYTQTAEQMRKLILLRLDEEFSA
jgi:protein-tyrosine phosphatase